MRRAHLVNYALYQIGWFACVLGAASHRPWTGCLIALTLSRRMLEHYSHQRLKALGQMLTRIEERRKKESA